MAISQDDSRVTFKSTDGGREEFFIFADPDMVLKWRKDKTIPLVDVVQFFEVYNGGKEGIAGHPSNQKLENTFGTTNDMEIIQQILQNGTVHHAHKAHERPTLKDHRAVINESRGRGASTTNNTAGIHQ
ncbi:16949_t:CDS:2 [Cetraspora pellucida]|uniref:16949_t:CDS:1 n=1 Tax=Cetraspora pellucida TaxID=1433469 RepID=A0A9N9GWY9_9GLOM|nr:16949_t:CDS:2 [Cetraspora pellucida]